jgi:hypothetical protein
MINDKLVSNCPLCEQHSLHIMDSTSDNQQCISCGYVTSEKFKLHGKMKKESDSYKELTEDMKAWSTVKNDRIWIPTIMTLPIGMLYPFNDENNELNWAFAEMIDIPEEEQKNYPRPDGGFYDKKLDTDNADTYDLFFDAMLKTNELIKKSKEEIKLPKLKKT